jgi:uncharacterized membrane protein YuzA (DUF378 family)
MNKSYRYIGLETVFLSAVVLASGTLFNIAYSSVVTTVLIVSASLLAATYHRFKLPVTAFYAIVLFAAFLICQSLILDIDSLVPNIKRVVKFFFIILGLNVVIGANEDFLNKIVKIILVFSFLSFIIYILMLIGVPLPTQSIPGQLYQSIFYLNVKNTALGLAGSGITLPRNFGIYWEPGLYQVYLNLMLLYVLFKTKKNLLLLIYLGINIFFTFSPTGYITSFAIILFYSMRNNEGVWKKTVFAIVGIIALYLVYPYFEKFMDFKRSTSSYEWRMQDIINGFQTFIKNPILGIGTSQIQYKSLFLSQYGVEHGNTNGLVSIPMEFGIFGIAFYSLLLFRSGNFFAQKYGISFRLCYMAWLICSLINEPIHTSEMLMLLMAVGMITHKKSYHLVKNNTTVSS